MDVGDLPGYFGDDDEPAPPPPPTPPPPPARAATTLVPLAPTTRPPTPTTVVVQVVPVPPAVAASLVAEWAAARSTVRAGHDRLTVRGATSGPSCCASHIRVDVRGRSRPPFTVELGCGPWSSTRAELHVVPVRVSRTLRGDRRRYYRAAHALLDELVRHLRSGDAPVRSEADAPRAAGGPRSRPRR